MAEIRDGALQSMPTFVRCRPLTSAALRFALHAHRDDWREGDGAPFILHPLEVASLLHACDCSDEVTAAAVLHDTLEATDATRAEIEMRFGAAVEHLVSCLTEDAAIDDVNERKAALRDQVERCNCDAQTIYVADKLSKVRELRIRLRAAPEFAAEPDGQRALTHYWRSLAMLESAVGDHPLVIQLRFELEAIRDLPPARTSRAALRHAASTAR